MIRFLGFLLLSLVIISCTKQSSFDAQFTDQTLRIDYFHMGDSELDSVQIDDMVTYGLWAGSKVNLVDTLPFGTYTHKLYNRKGDLIYARGFDSYFKEYQFSKNARDGMVKSFHESAILPMPKQEVEFVLEKRLASGELLEILRIRIDPKNVSAVNANDLSKGVLVVQSQNSGSAAVKADIAIIAEGYTKAEEEKFRKDLQRFTDAFFKAEPCKSKRDMFNVYGVFKASEDAGVDEPRAGIDKNTTLNTTFNSMGSERYLLTEDNKSLRNVAAHVPYDALYIMVNSKRYGGGGIYNFYCTFTSDNIWSEYLMVHEFGHSFFGLADEYYSSATAYDSFYPEGYEPAEANITAETDPAKVKWRHLFTEGIELPTPWEKEAYDKADYEWQQQRTKLNNTIAALQLNGAPAQQIKEAKAEYDALSLQRAKEAKVFLESSANFNKVGLFQGAGYMSTGMYRSSVNCIMFTRSDYFCPVCQEAMSKVIDWYAK